MPSPSKRIREYDERLFFAVAVPGFSTIAITGSACLQPQRSLVTDQGIAPDSPNAGERIEIRAEVTNTGPDRAVYPAVLWVDGAIEAARTVTVDPGWTGQVTFMIARPVGRYSVRIDRLLGAFTVGPADLRLPGAGGIAPTPALLVALGVAGLLIAAVGGYLAGRSHLKREGRSSPANGSRMIGP